MNDASEKWTKGQWERHPVLDFRIVEGNPYNADCWINEFGDTTYTAVGFDLNAYVREKTGGGQ